MTEKRSRRILLIPAYQPPQSFSQYAREISGSVDKLVVVNDGSGEEYEPIFSEIKALGNVDYITYGKNKGKGYALKYAMKHIAAEADDEDIIVTADCDGQHKCEDVRKIFDIVAEHKNSLILGSRNFNERNVPKRSSFGNTFTRRLYRILYGIKLYDTQTGLRGFTVNLAKRYLVVKGNRFEYEMNVLIESQRQGIEMLQVPIQTVYAEKKEERVSHFDTVKDSLRIFGTVALGVEKTPIRTFIAWVIGTVSFGIMCRIWLESVSVVNTLIAFALSAVITAFVNFCFKIPSISQLKAVKIRNLLIGLAKLVLCLGLLLLFGNAIGLPLIWVKAVSDIVVYIAVICLFHPQIEPRKKEGSFFGPLARFVKRIARIFLKEYRCNVLKGSDPCVYVCRHLDMHGPYTTIVWMSFDVHPMVYSVFATQKECYKQYTEYTFSERKGKKKKRFSLKAYILSYAVPAVFRSAEAVPVFRDANVLKTFKASMKYLARGESLIVYPDIDYTGSLEKESEIYEGFLYLGEMYRNKFGKSLRFVPLFIDEKMRTVEPLAATVADSFKDDAASASEYLKKAINGAAATYAERSSE